MIKNIIYVVFVLKYTKRRSDHLSIRQKYSNKDDIHN